MFINKKMISPSVGQKNDRLCKLPISIILLCVLMALSACQLTPKEEPVPPPPAVKPIDPELLKPIDKLSAKDAYFIQKALKRLGYRPGPIDGIWGPRSASALEEYQSDNTLLTANNQGRPTYHIINKLEAQSGLDRSGIVIAKPKPKISPSLRQIAETAQQKKTPQLVFIKRPLEMKTKANPYSKRLRRLNKGTGIYVIGTQEDWIHIETRDLVRGFVNPGKGSVKQD